MKRPPPVMTRTYPLVPYPTRFRSRGQGRVYARAVGRASRSAEAGLQARASGAPVLEHQKVALERPTQALDQIRPGASRDLASAIQRDPALLREAAAGRRAPLIDAMRQEARGQADQNLLDNRIGGRWQGQCGSEPRSGCERQYREIQWGA